MIKALKLKRRIPILLVVDCVVLFIASIGLYQLRESAALPIEFREAARSGSFVITSTAHSLAKLEGDHSYSEYWLSSKHQGEEVWLRSSKSQTDELKVRTVLQPRYHSTFLAVVGISVFVLMALGIYTYFELAGDAESQVFHLVCVSGALCISCSPGCYTVAPLGLGYAIRVLYYLSAALLPIALVHFSLVFPHGTRSHRKSLQYSLYAFSLLVALCLIIGFLSSSFANPLIDYASFVPTVLIACSVCAVLWRFVSIYKIADYESNRRKLAWAIGGVLLSSLAYLIAWWIPLRIWDIAWIREEHLVMSYLLAPIAISIALIRYGVLHIELIVNRSVVYFVVLTFLLGIYAIIIAAAVRLIGNHNEIIQLVIPITLVISVLLFAPARGLVQTVIDKTFFRVQYDYRNTQREMLEVVSRSLTKLQLAQYVIEKLVALLQPERIAFIKLEGDRHLSILAAENFSEEFHRISEVYNQNLFEATYSLLDEKGSPLGYICVGKKKSGRRLNEEDNDLLLSISAQCGAMLERFDLQQRVMTEQAEAARQAELNAMKSFFVSSVSHELKTPLTSIRMFAEMLRQYVSSDKAQQYVSIIEGESDRLTRLINNVLDYAKVERGIMEYNPVLCDANDVVARVMEIMKYQIKINAFRCDVLLCEKHLPLIVDPDALTEAIINLIANALKYSTDTKYLKIQTFEDERGIHLIVEDRGVGIPTDQIREVFSPFVQLVSRASNRSAGAGLGLALVKHFVDAHRGTILVASEVDLGTRVEIILQPEDVSIAGAILNIDPAEDLAQVT